MMEKRRKFEQIIINKLITKFYYSWKKCNDTSRKKLRRIKLQVVKKNANSRAKFYYSLFS